MLPLGQHKAPVARDLRRPVQVRRRPILGALRHVSAVEILREVVDVPLDARRAGGRVAEQVAADVKLLACGQQWEPPAVRVRTQRSKRRLVS